MGEGVIKFRESVSQTGARSKNRKGLSLVRNMSYMKMGEKFFKSAKEAGYMTSYSRDMCYAYDWTLEDKPTYSQR